MHLTSACGYVMDAQVAAAAGRMLAISSAPNTVHKLKTFTGSV